MDADILLNLLLPCLVIYMNLREGSTDADVREIHCIFTHAQ